MRILFLHLSDLHIQSSTAFDRFHIEKMLDSLRMTKGFDHMVMIFSGDIAQSGEAIQYDTARRIVATVFRLCKSKKIYTNRIDVLCVPGNHDVLHGPNPRTAQELNNIFSIKAYSSYVQSELQMQDNFFTFSQKNGCFSCPSLFDRKLLNYGGFKIEVNLINSAAFSLRKDEDKGLHYLSQEHINTLNTPTQADFVVSVMHHAPDWFIDDQKNQLEKALWSKSSLLFLGHEHRLGLKTVGYAEKTAAFVHAGGALCYSDDWTKSEFEFGVLDSDTFDYEYYSMRWNLEQNQYECVDAPKIFNLPRKPSVEKKLTVSSEFLSTLKKDDGHTVADSFEDYFVFPRLEQDTTGAQHPKELLNAEDFLRELVSEKRIIITGASGSGKTTLLKHLFLELVSQKCVIFCDIDSIKKKDSQKIVKSVFEDIYGTDYSDYVRFTQLPAEEKVLIIDDIDQIKPQNLDAYISSVSSEFGYMLFATKNVLNINMLDRMRASLKTDKNICRYKVSPFYTDKRKELISRVIACKHNGDGNAEEIVELLCNSIRMQKRFLTFSPDFIVSFAEYYYNNLGIATNSDSSVFSKVFEANITASLFPHQTADISVEKMYTLLGVIAHRIHFRKQYPIGTTSIFEAISEYNKENGDDVNALHFINSVTKAKILVEDPGENGYRFSNRSQLAYFVARAVNSNYQETGDERDLEYILRFSCFGINSDVLLFVSYITDNPKVLQLILNLTKELTEEWVEFDFGSNCPEFLRIKSSEPDDTPIETKEEQEKKEIEDEKQVCSQLEVIEIYDYSEEDAVQTANQIVRALSLLTVVAKALPGFEHRMKATMKTDFVNMIYSLPNKIFMRWASEVDKSYKEMIAYLKQEWRTSYGHQKESEIEDIERRFQVVAISLLLDIYNVAAVFATKDNSYKYLAHYPHEDCMTHSIEHLMMLEKKKMSAEFANSAVKLFDLCEEFLPKEMIYRIVRHAMVHMDSLKYQQRDQLRGKFYRNKVGQQKQARMLIERTKKLKNKD